MKLSEGIPDPLCHFQVVRTTHPELIRHAALTVFGASRVDFVSSRIEVQASFARLHSVALTFASTSADIRLNYPEADYYRFQFGVRGQAQTIVGSDSTTIDDSRACVTSPNRLSSMICSGGHVRLTLRIDAAAMTQKLGALLGGPPPGKLELLPALDLTTPYLEGLVQSARFLAHVVNSRPRALAPTALRELEQAVIVAALTSSRHAFSHLLDCEALEVAPLHIRLAEEFIEANWNRAISIDELSALTGVGARTLFRTFKKLRGYSPMQFARLVRLRRARAMLSAPQAGTSIVGASLACGFLNPGHFARYYQEAFGELPSRTLARHI
ncbi:MAG: AraC family transcriptional regulator [Bradyrhizobium sp.]|nr:AraC family transcriptional regulator [Bradyrhizobium sp.]